MDHFNDSLNTKSRSGKQLLIIIFKQLLMILCSPPQKCADTLARTLLSSLEHTIKLGNLCNFFSTSFALEFWNQFETRTPKLNWSSSQTIKMREKKERKEKELNTTFCYNTKKDNKHKSM